MKQGIDRDNSESAYKNNCRNLPNTCRYTTQAKMLESIYASNFKYLIFIFLTVCLALAAKVSIGNTNTINEYEIQSRTNQMLSNENIIWFRSGAIDILEESVNVFDPKIASDLKYNGFERNFGYYIVKFHPGFDESDQRTVLDKAEKFDDGFYSAKFFYVPNNCWIYRLSNDAIDEIKSLSSVMWIGPLVPSFRVLRQLALEPQTGDAHDGKVGIKIQVFQGDDYQGLAELLEQNGAELYDASRGANHEFIKIRVRPEHANEIAILAANFEGTEWVERYYPNKPVNDWSRWITQSYNFDGMRHGMGGEQLGAQMIVDELHVPIYRRGIYGQDQIVGYCDSGLDTNSIFFYDPGVEVPKQTGWATPRDTDHRKIRAYNIGSPEMGDFDDIDEEMHGHGTHVGGSIGGNNPANDPMDDIYDPADGMAPLCRLVFTDGANGVNGIYTPTDMNTMFEFARNCGAFIHSNSYGSASPNYYNSSAQECDEFMWYYPDFIVLFAAGNDNNDSPPSRVATYNCSKSLVSVGASETGFGSGGDDWSAIGSGETADPEDMAVFSSHGPTDEGMLKPNIVTPGGWNIWSADNVDGGSGGHTDIRKMGGTSMACPTAAGITALIRQYFMEGYYPTGSPQIEDRRFPSGALMKAMLINGTRNMRGQYTTSETGSDGIEHAPSNGQGWGRVVLDDCMYFDDDYGTDDRKLIIHDELIGLGTTGDAADFYIQCGLSETEPLKIVLSYSDYPGSPASGTPGVNDLDLTVTVGEEIYKGNVFAESGARSLTGGSADRINRDEVVWLDPVPGELIVVTIEAARVATGPQKYALVVSGDIEEGIPNERPDAPIYTNRLFDNQRLEDTQPVCQWLVPEDGDGHELHFVFQYDDQADFLSPDGEYRTDETTVGFSGVSFPTIEGTSTPVSYQFQSPLAEGTYWWRLRSYDGITYSNWTNPRSFTISSTDSISDWHQTTGEQFETSPDYVLSVQSSQVTLESEIIYLDEDFERYASIEEFESFWTTWGDFYSFSSEHYRSREKALLVDDDSWFRMSSVNINFEPLTKGYVQGWSMTTDEDDQSFVIALYKGDDRKNQVYNREGQVALWDGVDRHNLMEIDPGEWHHYRIDFDCEENEIICTIDETNVFGPYPFTDGAPENIDALRLGTLFQNSFTCETYYDDYLVARDGDNAGHIVSNPIALTDNPEGSGWNQVSWSQEEGDSIVITVEARTSSTWAPFTSGTTSGMSGTIDISALATSIDSIRLRADLYTDGAEAPDLYDWTVEWKPGDAIVERETEKPEELQLITAPNPFNSALSIYTGEKTTVTITDRNGRVINTIESDGQARWQPANEIPSGVYFISSDKGKMVQKALYIK